MELRQKTSIETHTQEGIPYMSLTWASCFRMATAHGVVFGIIGLITAAILAA